MSGIISSNVVNAADSYSNLSIDSAASKLPEIDGQRITFPTGDWYEVQSNTSFNTMGEGRDGATVPNGSYTVVNKTTGERFENVIVGASQSDTYQVQAGDTLSQIAEQNDLSLPELLNLNRHIDNPDVIQIGQSINLPTQRNSIAPNKGSTYVVKFGDTLTAIAKRNDVSLDELLSANTQINNPDMILVGQSINIPSASAQSAPITTSAPLQTYTVRSGDTLSEVAQNNGVSLDELLSLNQQINDIDSIQVGQRINLPESSVSSVGTVPENSVDLAPNIDTSGLLEAVPASIRRGNEDEISANIDLIVGVAQREGLTQEQTAYVLATATHESHMGLLLEELASGAAYEGRSDLGNTQTGDGVRFKGRGFVQLTGRANYQDWSNKLGIDLIGTPELAETPEVAAEILVRGMLEGSFTGRPLDRYVNESQNDFVNARRVVNGTDRADLIAGYANTFNTVLANSAPVAVPAEPIIQSEPAGGNTSVSVGPEGSGSDLLVKYGADIEHLDPVVVAIFDDIVAAYAAAGAPTPVITSGNDSRHSNGSLHYQDLAIDLRVNNLSDGVSQSIADDLAARLGADFDVIFEHFPNNPSNDHIHLEFDPD